MGEAEVMEMDTIVNGDAWMGLREIPDESVDLIVTSPPYNIGKEYESHLDLNEYKKQQAKIIKECVRTLKKTGSLCWQVGTYVKNSQRIPLDIYLFNIFTDLGLKFQNRIIWTFEFGLHRTKRFSGRYETVLWFTKTDEYIFNLDDVRVPQKYPRKKHFKGPKKGEYSCNPLGKNPGDVWYIPNVVHNHPEKTAHPCQFPEELVRRLILSMTHKGGVVLDPYMGSGTTAKTAMETKRHYIGFELHKEYVDIADKRLKSVQGTLI